MELSSLLSHHARYRPQATAVIFDQQRLDYRHFNARVNRAAHLLLGLGVKKTERVATLLPNTLELLEIYWACARIGAVAVPLSPLLTGSGLSSLINDAGAVCLVTQKSLLPVIEAVLPELATLSPPRILLVPAQIIALLDSPDFDPAQLASLEMILSLGAPLAQPRKDQLNQLLPGRFHELYGLTEGFLTILDKTDAVRKAGSVGCPPPFSEVRIVDEAGRDMRDPYWAGRATKI